MKTLKVPDHSWRTARGASSRSAGLDFTMGFGPATMIAYESPIPTPDNRPRGHSRPAYGFGLEQHTGRRWPGAPQRPEPWPRTATNDFLGLRAGRTASLVTDEPQLIDRRERGSYGGR